MKTHITTYNLLSSSLASPSYFVKCDPVFLDSEYRINSIKQKLSADISRKSVICLQEVSLYWASALHTYFANHGYQFITGLYGQRFNNYMGVGIAYPSDKFELVQTSIACVADTKKIIKSEPVKFMSIEKVVEIVNYCIKSFLGLFRKVYDVWNDALNKRNQIVALKLRDKSSDKQFCIGTYHMPCAYKFPSLMMIHCALSLQYMQNFAKNDPVNFIKLLYIVLT